MPKVVVGGVFADVTESRARIVYQLEQREWYKNTSRTLQAALILLPQEGKENHDGFLRDLANRPETMGGITVIRLARLAVGNFALIPVFDVVSGAGVAYQYEFVSWRHGRMSGVKGVVFVLSDGVPTHFVLMRGEKFSLGERVWDCIGGFLDPEDDGRVSIADRTLGEIREELGVPDLQVTRVVNLGEFRPDAGMTNNSPSIFAAFVESTQASRISDDPVNPDIYELKLGPAIFPMSQLGRMLVENSDAFFKGAIVQSVAIGLIDPSLLVYRGD